MNGGRTASNWSSFDTSVDKLDDDLRDSRFAIRDP
jgi:hypothetical protein